MSKITSLFSAAACAALATVAIVAGWPGAAAAWPERTVTIIVPYAAGGNTDVMARIAAAELQKTFGQTFVVENVLGAGGTIAAQKVASAKPDGHTLFFATTAQLSIAPYMQKVAYDPTSDFVPIAVFGQSFSVLGVHSTVPVNDLKQFVDYVKANPGKLNYGSGGVGTVGHLVSASFAARAGLAMTHVPYRGGALATNDLVAGQIQMYFGNSIELLPYYKSDKVRLLAVGTSQRVAQFPDVPAVAELYPGFSMPAWNGLLAPRGTPKAILDAVQKRVQEVVREPAVVERLRAIGVEAGGPAGDALARHIQAEQAAYKAAVTAAGIGGT
jgi:tripartite-type tricarboxylate transporter receptor subunit TctC